MDQNLSDYHHRDLLALVGDLDAAAAVVPIVPDVLTDAGRAIDGSRKLVVGERASTTLPAVLLGGVIAVSCALAGAEGTTDEVALIHGHVG